jgi:hypothetical protein
MNYRISREQKEGLKQPNGRGQLTDKSGSISGDCRREKWAKSEEAISA